MTLKTVIDPQQRFNFGKNWSHFLTQLNDYRIYEAEKSLQERLGIDCLTNMTFLDVGSGSGLFSLAAHRLGTRVHSFDYDQDSVECTKYLRDNFALKKQNWSIEQG